MRPHLLPLIPLPLLVIGSFKKSLYVDNSYNDTKKGLSANVTMRVISLTSNEGKKEKSYRTAKTDRKVRKVGKYRGILWQANSENCSNSSRFLYLVSKVADNILKIG